MAELPAENASTGLPAERDAIQTLREEQVRLREEVERLRQQRALQAQATLQDETRTPNLAEIDETRSGKPYSKKQKSSGSEKKDGDDEKDEKEEKKAPLKERVRDWTRQHPTGTILIVIGAVVLLILIFFLWRYLESYEDTDDAFVDGHTDPISPRISGFVHDIYVENTFRVKKGQLLVQLDPRDYELAKEQGAANLAQAEASFRAQTPNVPITATVQSTQVVNSSLNVTSAMANVAASDERYQAAMSDLAQAESNLANATQEAERYRQLVAKDEVSRELYDQRATDERAQKAIVASRKELARAAEKGVTQAQASMKQAEQEEEEAKHNLPRQVSVQRETSAMRAAGLRAAQAQYDQSAMNLDYTRIYAPDDGIIGDKQGQVGMQVAPGQELFALTQTNDIWVTANFKETQIRKMRAGQSVTINVDALSQKFDGYIEALPGASGAVYSLLPPENATGNYVKVVQRLPVRIRFRPNQQGLERLAPGMSVEPKVWVK
jgi:membrane fusion protein (multidrug efflux system)